MVKAYKDLSKGSKSRLSGTVARLHKSGITVRQVYDSKGKQVMSDIDLKKGLSFKGKKASFDGLKRNILQIQLSQERKEGLSTLALPQYVKFGYKGKKLSVITKELRKTAGLNIFFDISKKVQKQFNLTEKEAFRRTDLILKMAHTNYKKLSKVEKVILSFFS